MPYRDRASRDRPGGRLPAGVGQRRPEDSAREDSVASGSPGGVLALQKTAGNALRRPAHLDGRSPGLTLRRSAYFAAGDLWSRSPEPGSERRRAR
jgi:hypothetical protein